MLAGVVANAHADTITTYTLDSVSFTDGGTATGSVTLDNPHPRRSRAGTLL